MTSARHSSWRPCRARAAGVARSGLMHCFRVRLMAANMSPPCWYGLKHKHKAQGYNNMLKELVKCHFFQRV